MCSLHPRLLRKYRKELDEMLGLFIHEASDGDLFRLKSMKNKAADELQQLAECASVDKYLKVFQSPTPTKKEQITRHIEEMIKQVS